MSTRYMTVPVSHRPSKQSTDKTAIKQHPKLTCEGLYKLFRRQLAASILIGIHEGLAHRLKDVPVHGFLPIFRLSLAQELHRRTMHGSIWMPCRP